MLTGAAGATVAARASASVPPVNPPALTGMRGSRDADLVAAHRLRDGAQYRVSDYPVSEEVDCVVIGAGLSGLSAAHFLTKSRPQARLLILDNHDDFGGHARRNEFRVGQRQLIGYGGSESIQSPKSQWSPVALGLLSDLGVRIDRFERAIDTALYPGLGLSSGMFFAREDFGVDRLVTGDPQRSLPSDIPAALHHGRSLSAFLADCPLSETQRHSIYELYTARRELFPDQNRAARRELLGRMSYAEFLTRYWSLDATTLKIFLGRTRDLFALSADHVPAIEAAGTDLPGFQGLDLEPESDAGYEYEPYIYHFPDGNASIARLLVRSLIPHAAPGTSMEDIVTARFAYAALDQALNRVRLRLSSTVVKLENTNSHVDVLYAVGTEIKRVRCRDAIYGGYAAMLPYVCAQLPLPQREVVSSCTRSPLVYVTVALRHWRPWQKVGVHYVVNPTGFYSVMKLDYPVSLGRYRFARTPDEPILLHLSHVPLPAIPVADRRTSIRLARQTLLARPFADFEAALRDEVTRIVGSGGFNADRDIAAITVNRWGHGYAYDYNALSDPSLSEATAAIGKRAIGRISVAGSDVGWGSYAHVAIDEGHRAASEVLARTAG